MQKLPTVKFPGLDKTYVKEVDLVHFMTESTTDGEWRFVKAGVR